MLSSKLEDTSFANQAGRIVAVGMAKDGAFERVAVVRMLSNGSVDPSFAPMGKVLVGMGTGASYAYAIAIQGDGKVVLTGPAKGQLDSDFAVARLEAGVPSIVFEGFAVSTAFGKPVIISAKTIMAKARDAEGDAMSVVAAAASANGATIHAEAGEQWTYTPPADFVGIDSLPITITDSCGGSLTTAITIQVGPPPDAGGPGVNPPRLTQSADGQMEIAFNGIPGRQYLVQRSLDLQHWETIATVIADPSGAVRHLDKGPESTSVFYRLAVKAP